MRLLLTRALMGALAFLPCTAAAVEAPGGPELLMRVGGWEVNYDEEACHLGARFGEGDRRVYLRLTRYAPGDRVDVYLVGTPLASIAVQSPLTLRPLPDGLESSGTAQSGTLAGEPLLLVWGATLRGLGPAANSTAPVTPAEEAAVTGLSFKVDHRKPLVLKTGSMGRPMAALRTCMVDLARHWGLTEAEAGGPAIAPIPAGRPGTWLTSRDYPSKLLRNGENGFVAYRLVVGTNGKVDDCVVQGRSDEKAFADLTCTLLRRRAHFTPAMDRDGRPIRSIYQNRVRWVIPE